MSGSQAVEVVFTYTPAGGAKTLEAIQPLAINGLRTLRASPIGKLRCRFDDLDRVGATEGVRASIVPPFSSYTRILKVLDDAANWSDNEKERSGHILCISLSYGAGVFDRYEPMNIATRAAARNGITTVIAAGNDGPAENTLNPWAVAPWVVGVGAANRDGSRLWDESSRGLPGDGIYRPDVVAWGEDVPVPKSAGKTERLEHGTAGALVMLGHFDEAGGETVSMSGTSLAAPAVARLCAFLYAFVQQLELAAPVGTETFGEPNWPLFRLLEVLDAAGIGYEIKPSPAVIGRALRMLARPIEGVPTHAAGAGFVDDVLLFDFLARFSSSDFCALFGLDPDPDIEARLGMGNAESPLIPVGAIKDVISHAQQQLGFADYPVVFAS